jgi:hypothetical protein
MKHIAVALMFAEIELQFHPVPPLNPSTNEKNNTPALQWTGNAIDLVEMIS